MEASEKTMMSVTSPHAHALTPATAPPSVLSVVLHLFILIGVLKQNVFMVKHLCHKLSIYAVRCIDYRRQIKCVPLPPAGLAGALRRFR